MAQLIRDLILFQLPTSVHSQLTMVGAFAARSSQVDYGEGRQIEDFCRNYYLTCILNHYTKDGFYYRLMNRILRQECCSTIYQYRHTMIDMMNCLKRLFSIQTKSNTWTLYRGQQITIFELEKLKNNVGELISCSSFFSTTFNHQLAQIFAGDGSDDNPYYVSIIFQISLGPNQPIRPYARIENSAEEEMLFSPGTRFRLMSCRKLHDRGQLWFCELLAIPEDQQKQLMLNHGETFLLLSSASGWPTSVVVVHVL